MRDKLLIFAVVFLSGIFSAHAQDRADQQHLENKNSFSMVILGDPQGYIKYDINQPIFDLCTAWIADNIENLNIKAVLCTGDLVEQNENIVRNRKMLNQTSSEMWKAVSNSFKRLDNKVPYFILPVITIMDIVVRKTVEHISLITSHSRGIRRGAISV